MKMCLNPFTARAWCAHQGHPACGVRAQRQASPEAGSDGERACRPWCASKLPMLLEQAALSTRNQPMVAEAPERTKARLVPMVIEPVADGVRATCRWCSSKLPAAAQGTWAQQGPAGSDGDRASCRWCSSHWAHQGSTGSDGVRATSAHQGSIGSDGVRGNCRWCASQEPASRSKKHKPMVVEAPGRTKVRLVPMVIEPLADGVRATCRWCSSKLPAAAQGMCRWLSRYLGAPRPDWFRW